jgi:hypothetical protein
MENLEKAPRRLTPFHQYLKLHYHSRVKGEYLRRYAIAKKEYDNATEEEQENKAVKKPIPVQLRTEVATEFWLLETEKFRASIANIAEETYVKEVEEWEELKMVPKTAQQFHQWVFVLIC